MGKANSIAKRGPVIGNHLGFNFHQNPKKGKTPVLIYAGKNFLVGAKDIYEARDLAALESENRRIANEAKKEVENKKLQQLELLKHQVAKTALRLNSKAKIAEKEKKRVKLQELERLRAKINKTPAKLQSRVIPNKLETKPIPKVQPIAKIKAARTKKTPLSPNSKAVKNKG